MGLERAKKIGLIPKEKNCVVYEVPVGIVNPDPNISKELLNKLVSDFEIKYSQIRNVSILGYSIGNYPAFFVANHFPVSGLVSVVPSGRLGAALWEGIGTQEVRRRSQVLGVKSHQEYDFVIGNANPIENVANLPRNIEIHLATHDRYIPSRFGEELALTVQNTGRDVKVYRNYRVGHVLTLLRFANRFKFD